MVFAGQSLLWEGGRKGSMELTLSISHRFQVWIRVRIEDSSRNREKERKSDLAGEMEINCLLNTEAKQNKWEALQMCESYRKGKEKAFFLSLSWLGEDVMGISQVRKTQIWETVSWGSCRKLLLKVLKKKLERHVIQLVALWAPWASSSFIFHECINLWLSPWS